MKRIFVFFVFFAVLALTVATAQDASAGQAVAELSFTFTKQSGHSSNQFAVWVEDAGGVYVKTLYATRYTANGGYKRRATSLPQWVKQSGLAGMSKAQVDALTGATPKTGTLTYRWDGTDSLGAALPAGNYVIRLEGTLRGENQVYYRAPVQIGQEGVRPGAVEVSVEYTGTANAERSMISGVKARTL